MIECVDIKNERYPQPRKRTPIATRLTMRALVCEILSAAVVGSLLLVTNYGIRQIYLE